MQNDNKYILKIVLFIFCGIPGGMLILFSVAFLFANIIDPSPQNPSIVQATIYFLLGCLLTLIGIGKIKQWLYVFVFLSIPIVFFSFLFLDEIMKGFADKLGGFIVPLMLACVAFIAFLMKGFVDKYYSAKERSNNNNQ